MESTSERQRILLHFLERLGEPLCFPRADGNFLFQLPVDLIEERLRPIIPEMIRTLSPGRPDMIIPVPRPNILPHEMRDIFLISRSEPWSIFVPKHRRAAYALADFFIATCRERVNRNMFAYAMSAAVLKRRDLRGVRLPAVWETLPDCFVQSSCLGRARYEASLPPQSRKEIELGLEVTGTNIDPEHRVAYFREDVGINAHHWHWHLVYPLNAKDRDRKGELFYYMHRQLVARYDAERLSNGLNRVERLLDWSQPIQEAYFPKLTNENAGFVWGSRPAGLKLRDIDRKELDLKFDIDDLRRWKDRIFEAIHKGFLINSQGENITLTEDRGIDLLGDVLEASEMSINQNFYGDLHNYGHVALAFLHDPDNRHKEKMGVMADPTTAIRDPVFFRWHKFVDDIFQEYKYTLSSYTTEQLNFPGIEVVAVSVESPSLRPNELSTHWQSSQLDVSRGLDLRRFGSRGPVTLKFTHLQHRPFQYVIKVRNTSLSPADVTIRLFLAPRLDETGRRIPLQEQSLLYIELDKFQITVIPGESEVQRASDMSSVTIPMELSFRQLETASGKGSEGREADVQPGATVGSELDADQSFCGCGWPQHMLLPRGNPSGMLFDLFVHATDWNIDKVTKKEATKNGRRCNGASSYCGLQDELYPDKRPMGFPFDRKFSEGVKFLEDFLTPNMNATQVVIRFEDRIVDRSQFNSKKPPQ